MSGERRSSDAAQLALLDAMVFFAIAMAIMLILSSYSSEYLVRADDSNTSSSSVHDPSELLRVVLSASISESVTVPVAGGVQIRPGLSIAECLIAELELLIVGFDIAVFGEMNAVVLGLVYSLLVPCCEASLLAFEVRSNSTLLLLSVGELRNNTDWRDSSHALLPSNKCLGFLICLVLSPSALPELGQIG